MSVAREALQMRFHFGERDRAAAGPLDAAVMDACARHGVWAAALLRGIEGFGSKHLERTDRLLSLSEDAPLVAVAVGDAGRVEALAAEVCGLAADGLLTIEGVDVVEGGGAEDAGVDGDVGRDVGVAGLATTGTPTTTAAGVGVPVVGSLGDRVGDVVRATVWGPRSGSGSPHRRIVDALYRRGAESATVLLGVDGVLDGERRRARFVASNQGVPAVTVAVGERGAIAAALAEVEGLADLVTIEGVERNRPYATERLHAGEGVERNSVIDREKLHGSATGAAGAEATRVALVTSEGARGGGRPLYLALIRALRSGGAPGATALRGIWGFRGEVPPHGDRVLALRRDVPVIVETVDSAARAGEWFEIAASLAGEADVAYSQRGLRIPNTD